MIPSHPEKMHTIRVCQYTYIYIHTLKSWFYIYTDRIYIYTIIYNYNNNDDNNSDNNNNNNNK